MRKKVENMIEEGEVFCKFEKKVVEVLLKRSRSNHLGIISS
jgi:hypothetical protein